MYESHSALSVPSVLSIRFKKTPVRLELLEGQKGQKGRRGWTGRTGHNNRPTEGTGCDVMAAVRGPDGGWVEIYGRIPSPEPPLGAFRCAQDERIIPEVHLGRKTAETS